MEHFKNPKVEKSDVSDNVSGVELVDLNNLPGAQEVPMTPAAVRNIANLTSGMC